MSEARPDNGDPRDEEVVAGQVDSEEEMYRSKLGTIFSGYGFQLHSSSQRSGGECCWMRNPGRADFSYIQYHWGPDRSEETEPPRKGAICLTACQVSLQEMIRMLEPTGQFRVKPYVNPQGEARGLFWVYPI